jgi:hypothetical protein
LAFDAFTAAQRSSPGIPISALFLFQQEGRRGRQLRRPLNLDYSIAVSCPSSHRQAYKRRPCTSGPFGCRRCYRRRTLFPVARRKHRMRRKMRSLLLEMQKPAQYKYLHFHNSGCNVIIFSQAPFDRKQYMRGTNQHCKGRCEKELFHKCLPMETASKSNHISATLILGGAAAEARYKCRRKAAKARMRGRSIISS